MALVSPGLQLSVTDESQYVPGAVGSVPLVLLATAQDKRNPSGALANGTTKANAGKLQVFSSQRELVSAMGYPTFQQSAAGSPLHGDERNEYGLMAGYSAMGVANRIYAIRADIDLTQLRGTSNRPTGMVSDGTYWLDLGTTDWGVFEWDASANLFTEIRPMVITASTGVTADLGDVGSYAITLTGAGTGGYTDSVWTLNRKSSSNTWNVVGSNNWQSSLPTIKGTLAPTGTTALNDSISINGITVIISLLTVTQVAAAIVTAAITGVTASVVGGRLEIYSNSLATNGQVVIANVTGTPLTMLGIVAGTYNRPTTAYGTYVGVPAWRSTDTGTTRPSGSVYIKTTVIGSGANIVVKKYSAGASTWSTQAAPLYQRASDANFGLDPSGGGYNIAAGTTWTRYNVNVDGSLSGNVTYKTYTRRISGATKITANVVGAAPFTNGNTFSIQVTKIGASGYYGSAGVDTTYTITLGGTSRAAWVQAVLAANIPEVTAAVEASGAISLTHKYGGNILLTELTGTPVATAGFATTIPGVLASAVTGQLELSNWGPLVYTYSATEPTQNPADGTLWYYGSVADVDIMINTTGGWKGYYNESSDARGYALNTTDVNGVIVSAVKPTTQTTSAPLVPGDLWLDSSALENWPKLSRFNGTTWIDIDNTDHTSQNGIVFADARWDTDGTTDVVNSTLVTVKTLLTSDYIDQDAPDYRLYPRGTLLFNTRRSGSNVKRFVSNYFNSTRFSTLPTVPGASGSLPAVSNAWVSASGLRANGSMYSGNSAQRQMIVSALKAAVDGSTSVREEQYAFNLIVAPGYPELISNMVGLNNDRVNTAFVIGDTPFRLAPNAVSVANWSNNTDNSTGLSTNDPYLGVYYPGAAQTNDVQGNTVVVPPSHIALRTFIRSDSSSYQWFAPAGTRRGLVDNASSVGYIDSLTGEYVSIGVNQGLRDSLYETKINPITNLPGIGLTVWGQKTRNPTSSSMDRINVARLVNYLRTVLASVGNGFLFEPNDKITRDQLKTIISGAVNDLVSKRGVYDYLVVCDDSNNTPARIARNELYVDIAIEPMKGVEFIYIPIRLYNPGDVARLGK